MDGLLQSVLHVLFTPQLLYLSLASLSFTQKVDCSRLFPAQCWLGSNRWAEEQQAK